MKRFLLIMFMLVACIPAFAQDSSTPRNTFLARKYTSYNANRQDSGSLNYLLSSIGTSQYATILIDNGEWKVTNDITVPSKIAFEFARGSYFTNAGSWDVNINSVQNDSYWSNNAVYHQLNVEYLYASNMTLASIGITNIETISGASISNCTIVDPIWSDGSPVFSASVGGVTITNGSVVTFVPQGDLTIEHAGNSVYFNVGGEASQQGTQYDSNTWKYARAFTNVFPSEYSNTFNIPFYYAETNSIQLHNFTLLSAVCVGAGGSNSTADASVTPYGVESAGYGGAGGGFVYIDEYPITNGAEIQIVINSTVSLCRVNGEAIAWATAGAAHDRYTFTTNEYRPFYYDNTAVPGTGYVANSSYGGCTYRGGYGGDIGFSGGGSGGGAAGYFFGNGGNGGDGTRTADNDAGGGGGGICGQDGSPAYIYVASNAFAGVGGGSASYLQGTNDVHERFYVTNYVPGSISALVTGLTAEGIFDGYTITSNMEHMIIMEDQNSLYAEWAVSSMQTDTNTEFTTVLYRNALGVATTGTNLTGYGCGGYGYYGLSNNCRNGGMFGGGGGARYVISSTEIAGGNGGIGGGAGGDQKGAGKAMPGAGLVTIYLK